MEADLASKSYYNLEELIRKESLAKCSSFGEIARDSGSKFKLQRKKLDELLEKLNSEELKHLGA